MASRSPTRGERCHAGLGLALDAPRKSRRVWALRTLTTERDQLVRGFPSAAPAHLSCSGGAGWRPRDVSLQPATSLEIEVLRYDGLRGPRRRDVEHEHARPPHVREGFLPRVQQLLGGGLAKGVVRHDGARA